MIIDTQNQDQAAAAVEKTQPPTEIPEGKILSHVELHCSKHDDITKGSIFLSYTTRQKEGKTIQHQNFFCVQCLSELLAEFAEQGKIGKLQMVRVFRDRTPEDDEIEKQQQAEAQQETENASASTPENVDDPATA